MKNGNSVMDEEQINLRIEKDLFNELKWLLCAATEWEAHRQLVDIGKMNQPCNHLQVYTMDSVLLHARSLYEFFTAAPNRRPERFTWQDFGPRQSSALYSQLKTALHGRAMHVDKDRTRYEEIKNEVIKFAKDVLHLWAMFSEMPGVEPYKEALEEARKCAIEDAKKVAQQYAGLGFQSPFA